MLLRTGLLVCLAFCTALAAPVDPNTAVSNSTAVVSNTVSDATIAQAPLLTQKRFVAYFIAWGIYGRNYQPSDIPAAQITHLNYAFANIDSSGKVILGDSYADVDKAYPGDSWDTAKQPFRGTFNQILKVMKKTYPKLKVLLSIGGWTWSGKFSDVANDATMLQTFAQSCLDMIEKYGFDGVDLDWEYPVEGGLSSNSYRPNDGENYVLLLQAIRDKIGSGKLITIAAPAGPQLTRHLKIPEMAVLLDFMNVMTYDFRGGWSKYTGHQTPLYPSTIDPDPSLTCTSQVVDYYLKNGMPADKITIGAAFYGRGWTGVPDGGMYGLFQKFTTVPTGSWDDGTSGPTGVFDYKDVVKKIKAGQLTRYWDGQVHAPWGYDEKSGLMISYDDPESIVDKAAFIWEKGLGGMMVWELSGDDKSKPLVDVIYAALSTQQPSLPNSEGDVVPSPNQTAARPNTMTIPQSSLSSSWTSSGLGFTSIDMASSSSLMQSSWSLMPTVVIPPPTNDTMPTVTMPKPTGPPPTMTSPSGGGGSQPTSTGALCVSSGQSCAYLTDVLGCDGDNLAFCLSTGLWYTGNCAPGTVCRVVSNVQRVACLDPTNQWQMQDTEQCMGSSTVASEDQPPAMSDPVASSTDQPAVVVSMSTIIANQPPAKSDESASSTVIDDQPPVMLTEEALPTATDDPTRMMPGMDNTVETSEDDEDCQEESGETLYDCDEK